MVKLALIIANGSEEIEALTPVDVIRRANSICDIVSVSGEYPVGSHNITVKADLLAENLDMDNYDGIIIAGGMPGAVNASNDKFVKSAIVKAFNDGKLVSAICASPAVVLSPLGVLNGKKATCFPAEDFINALSSCGATYTAKDIEIDGTVITANGPKSAMNFALKICEYFNIQPKI